jgi:hypothetical protein
MIDLEKKNEMDGLDSTGPSCGGRGSNLVLDGDVPLNWIFGYVEN